MRFDLQIIASLVEENSRVLDMGCGAGDLLAYLQTAKKVKGYGIEIDEREAIECVEKGLSVIQGDLNEETAGYADQSFDYVILSQTLQQVYNSEKVIREMLRVGKNGIVSFPCFSHFAIKWQLVTTSRAPMTKELPYKWYDTPNIRVITLKDFRQFCREQGIRILREIAISSHYRDESGKIVKHLPDWLAKYGIFLVTKR